MKTQADLINKVLSNLGVIVTGQEPSAEDVETVRVLIAPKFAELAYSRVYYVPDCNAIDDAVFLPLATLVASEAAPDFGQQHDLDAEARAMYRLRNVDRSPCGNDTLATEYF